MQDLTKLEDDDLTMLCCNPSTYLQPEIFAAYNCEDTDAVIDKLSQELKRRLGRLRELENALYRSIPKEQR